ncbi:MAG: hypothetical protein GC206_13265 [Alphaproteobacteria bacterium]|nr:hypothetical protein [Alphaproteobacteria bacterium]
MSLKAVTEILTAAHEEGVKDAGMRLMLLNEAMLEHCANVLNQIGKGEVKSPVTGAPVDEVQRKAALAKSGLFLAALEMRRAMEAYLAAPCGCDKCRAKRSAG